MLFISFLCNFHLFKCREQGHPAGNRVYCISDILDILGNKVLESVRFVYVATDFNAIFWTEYWVLVIFLRLCSQSYVMIGRECGITCVEPSGSCLVFHVVA
jgi:hypothetical protein